ncbi:MAG: chromosomal replication initiator protein DnaA, partial [Candidatus Omnitrophica bacterium]|nr:chromosomal replication initiator protein DnaA [Candidatus Omnitrophota bacterium]
MAVLEQELSSAAIERWFKNIEPGEIRDGKLIICVPDDFFKSWIEDNYSSLIGNALKQCNSPVTDFLLEVKKITFTPTSVAFEDPRISSSYESVALSQGNSSGSGRSGAQPNLNPQYTLGEFVVGPSNRFAHAACIAVAEQPAKAYNPLFIYGPVGLGKTHLMQAIGHEVYRKNPNTRVLYITSEKFTNQLISSIQNQTTQQFREKYRNVDILLIDDIHFIAGKEATQEEFFFFFYALYDNHKQIIVSSDRTPKDIINMEERLISRFEWGLVTDIQKPDFETRSAILRKKAERHRIPVPDEVTNFIAEVVTSNIRELEGSLMR